MLYSSNTSNRSLVRNKVALFGYGVIGKQTARVIKPNVIIDWDAKKQNYKPIKGKMSDLKDCLEVWLCVPTPSDQKGKCDISAIMAIALMLKASGLSPDLVIRSTVAPGTAKKLQDLGFGVVSFPEFLSMKTAKQDTDNPWFVVLGTDNYTWFTDDFLHRHNYFRKLSHKIFVADNQTAEMIKYACNSFFATLVIFGNQIYDACQKAGADYKLVREVLEMIPWPEQTHWNVFHNGYRGYGGRCLPKDTLALATQFNLPLLKAVDKINGKYVLNNNSDLQSGARNSKGTKKPRKTKLSKK